MSLSRRSILGGLLGLVAAPVATFPAPAPRAAPPAPVLTEAPLQPPAPALLQWGGASWAAAHALLQAYRMQSIYPDMSGSERADALAKASREAIEEGNRMLEEPAYAWLDGATT